MVIEKGWMSDLRTLILLFQRVAMPPEDPMASQKTHLSTKSPPMTLIALGLKLELLVSCIQTRRNLKVIIRSDIALLLWPAPTQLMFHESTFIERPIETIQNKTWISQSVSMTSSWSLGVCHCSNHNQSHKIKISNGLDKALMNHHIIG